jgi:hypothetical protein
MDLLENYLAAVRRNLPASQADDIVAELRDDLLAQAEERQERTGSVDWTALLRDSGHPLVVAARNRKQQWLIGPELYPFYVHFLKKIVGIVLIVVTAIHGLKAAAWPSDVGHIVTGYLFALWTAAAVTIGSVTILFLLVERFSGDKAGEAARQWNPDELPDVDDAQPSTTESVFELSVGVLMLLWWIGAIPTPDLTNGSFRLAAASVWASLYWPVAVLLVARIVYNLVRWLRPRWKAARLVLGAGTGIAAIAIALLVYRAGQWVTVVPGSIDPGAAQGLQSSLDLSFRIGLLAVIVVWAWSMAAEVWKGRRAKTVERPARS